MADTTYYLVSISFDVLTSTDINFGWLTNPVFLNFLEDGEVGLIKYVDDDDSEIVQYLTVTDENQSPPSFSSLSEIVDGYSDDEDGFDRYTAIYYDSSEKNLIESTYSTGTNYSEYSTTESYVFSYISEVISEALADSPPRVFTNNRIMYRKRFGEVTSIAGSERASMTDIPGASIVNIVAESGEY